MFDQHTLQLISIEIILMKLKFKKLNIWNWLHWCYLPWLFEVQSNRDQLPDYLFGLLHLNKGCLQIDSNFLVNHGWLMTIRLFCYFYAIFQHGIALLKEDLLRMFQNYYSLRSMSQVQFLTNIFKIKFEFIVNWENIF